MFRLISNKIQYAEWAYDGSRYRCLDLRDRLLDGTFYEHLQFAFYQETRPGTEQAILLDDRRPSSQYRLPRYVARWTARKLFSGRHTPKIRHPDVDKAKEITAVLAHAKFFARMTEAVLLGSVGSVAMTFRYEAGAAAGDAPRIAFRLWRSKFCVPSFDEFGELTTLRVQYLTDMGSMRAMGLTGDSKIEDRDPVWYVRDFTTTSDIIYEPVPQADWNPKDGFARKEDSFAPSSLVVEHNLGFVPGQWFINLPGGQGADGVATWEDAIPMAIEIDYLLSQTARGARYNSAPQLVLVGELLNGENWSRGPASYLQVSAGVKQEAGDTLGAGDAKLLEMTGTGTTATLELIDKLRNLALEQIAASRKDPEKMKGPMSGRAMEYLDEDSDDLVMELRSQYGEHGSLPLIRKLCMAAGLCDDAGSITLQWPRLTQPTPDEVLALVQAFQIALQPVDPPQAAPAGPRKPGAPPPPAPKPIAADPNMQLITPEQARAYLGMVLDVSMLDTETDQDSPDDIMPNDVTSPASDATNDAPMPLPDSQQSAPTPADNEGEGATVEGTAVPAADAAQFPR